MAYNKDSLEKVEFAQWGLDEATVDCEVSTGSTTFKSSVNKVAGSAKPEPTISIIGMVRNAAAKIPKTKKELGDSVRSAKKATTLKTVAAVLLAVLLVWLLYVQYQTTSALVKVDHLAKEVDDLKVKLMVNEHLSTIKDSESNATIQFRDVRKFLDSDEKEKHGESFHFNDLSWHLSIKKISYSLKDQPDQFLAVYVCHDISDFFGYRFNDWYLHATFNLKMVSHDQKRKSFTEHFVGLFEKSESYDCLGKIFFVPIGDLYDGFVKDDAIDFELQFNNLKLLLKLIE